MELNSSEIALAIPEEFRSHPSRTVCFHRPPNSYASALGGVTACATAPAFCVLDFEDRRWRGHARITDAPQGSIIRRTEAIVDTQVEVSETTILQDDTSKTRRVGASGSGFRAVPGG